MRTNQVIRLRNNIFWNTLYIENIQYLYSTLTVCDIRSNFKPSTAYLLIAKGRMDEFVPFPKVLAQSEMRRILSRN